MNINTYIRFALIALNFLAITSRAQSDLDDDVLYIPASITSNLIVTTEINTNRLTESQNLKLTATFTNNWTNNVSIKLTGMYFDCETIIKNMTGELIPLSRYGIKTRRKSADLGIFESKIPPMKTHIYEIPLGQIYDITYPEQYTVISRVRVTLSLGDTIRHAYIESEPLSFTVLRRP